MNKESQIVLAAQKLFAQFGIKKVTVEEIAKAAGVSKITLYKYFEDKNQIFKKVLETETEQMFQMLYEAVDKENTVFDKLKIHLIVKMTKIRQLSNFYKVAYSTWEEHWPVDSEVRENYLNKEKELIKSILEAGINSGELAVEDAEMSAYVLTAALKSFEHYWVSNEQKVDIETMTAAMLKILFNGIKNRNNISAN